MWTPLHSHVDLFRLIGAAIHFLSPETYIHPPVHAICFVKPVGNPEPSFFRRRNTSCPSGRAETVVCGESLTTGEIAMGGTTLCWDDAMGGTRVRCETTQRCLMLWTVAYFVLCQGEKGEHSTLLAILQRVCFGLTEHASRRPLVKVDNLKAYINL